MLNSTCSKIIKKTSEGITCLVVGQMAGRDLFERTYSRETFGRVGICLKEYQPKRQKFKRQMTETLKIELTFGQTTFDQKLFLAEQTSQRKKFGQQTVNIIDINEV